jgi:hypothetical protein
MDGFDAVVEIGREGLRQLVRAYWASQEGTEAFKEIEKEITQKHRVWPTPLPDGEDVEEGLALAIKIAPRRTVFGAGNPLGLPENEAVDIALYANSNDSAVARLWMALRIQAEVLLLYPGELSPFRKCGDFIALDASMIVLADAQVSRGPIAGESDALLIQPESLRLERAVFFGEAQLPPDIRGALNETITQLLPLLVGNRSVPISSKLDRLHAKAPDVTLPAGHPLIVYRTLNAEGTDVTGMLTGDDRFAAGIETSTFAACAFGWGGQAPRNPDASALIRRQPLLRGRQSHIAMSISDWSLEYFEHAHVESTIRAAFNDAIIKQRGEPAQDRNAALRYRAGEGWALYQLPNGPVVLEEDDDVLIVINAFEFRIRDGKVFAKSTVRLVQQPLDIGFLDWLDPDNDLRIEMGLQLKVHPPPALGEAIPNYTELVPEIVDWNVVRLDSPLEQVWSFAISLLDLAKTIVTGIAEGIVFVFSGEVDFSGTKRAATSYAIDLAVFLAPMSPILSFLAPDLFSHVLDPEKMPALELFGSKNHIQLLFKDAPQANLARNGEEKDHGLTIFACIEINKAT